MAQRAIELILTRQLASCLAIPIFVVDPRGDLLYYNEPAEPIIGSRFEEVGEMRLDEWFALSTPCDEDGTPLKKEDHPIVSALRRNSPAHRRFWIHGTDGVARGIEGTAFPIVGQQGRVLGAMAMFWETTDP